MIFVSSETGSTHLVSPLRKAGLPVEDPIKLDYADLEFSGRGMKGVATSIGIEIKKLSELTSDWDRFAGEQIPKMVKHYDYRYLMYQGEWRQDRKGKLLRRTSASSFRPLHGQCNASALRKKLYGLPLRAGVLTYPTRDELDTVRHIVDLYRMWNDDNFENHKSHLVLYQPHSIIEYSPFVKAVGAWPEVGITRARAAEKLFKTVRRAAMGGLHEWAGIETFDKNGHARKLGLKDAAKIVTFLEGI